MKTLVYLCALLLSAIAFSGCQTAKKETSAAPTGEVAQIKESAEAPLCEAVRKNDVGEIKRMLNAGDLNDQWLEGKNPLMWAAVCGHAQAAELLLLNGARIDAVSPGWERRISLLRSLWVGQGMTPLMFASESGHENLVRLLVGKGAQVNAADAYARTALHLAADNGHLAVVEFLAGHGAELNAVTRNGLTPLMLAAGAGKPTVVEWLLAHGANLNATATVLKKTALFYAACDGRTDCVRLLLDKGADVNSPNSDGYTALMGASDGGHVETARLLIERGADVTAQTDQGVTAAALVQAKIGQFDDKNPLEASVLTQYRALEKLLAAHAKK